MRLAPDRTYIAMILCALSDSRVLCGQEDSKYLELLRVDVAVGVESGARVASVDRLDVTEQYDYVLRDVRQRHTRRHVI